MENWGGSLYASARARDAEEACCYGRMGVRIARVAGPLPGAFRDLPPAEAQVDTRASFP